MRGINVRKKQAAGGSIATGGAINPNSVGHQARSILAKLAHMIDGERHENSKLPFGGALLAPHVSKTDLENKLKPIYDKLAAAGTAARNHPSAQELLNFQQQLVDRAPALANAIQSQSKHNGRDLMNIKNPFDDMNPRQLYHHVMNMSNTDWMHVRDTAGEVAGKVQSVFGHRKAHDGKLLGGVLSGTKTQVSDLDRHIRSHLVDISLSRDPHVAAERLERDHLGGSSHEVLKKVLWASHQKKLGFDDIGNAFTKLGYNATGSNIMKTLEASQKQMEQAARRVIN